MIETTINMPEWHADISLGFANLNVDARFKQMPEKIGSLQVRMTSMENFTFDSIRYDYLRLERCENNSFSETKWLP